MKKRQIWLTELKRNPAVAAGLTFLLVFAAVALLAPLLAPYAPDKRCDIPYLRPSVQHLLGTNDIGQDIFSEMVYGTRVSLTIGVIAALCSTAAGSLFGLMGGYLGGTADRLVCAAVNVMMALPGLPLTLVLVAFLGGSMRNMIFIICFTSWAGTARIVRSRVQQLKEAPFIKIESALGAGKMRIMLYHLLPNVMDIILTRFALSVGSAMTTESSLSFLGLGSYGQKSWGNVLHYAFYNGGLLRGFYWWYLPPVVCISLCMMSFMLITGKGRAREGLAGVGGRRKRNAEA